MRQSRLLAQQVFSRPRRIEHFRRRAWLAPSARISRPTDTSVNSASVAQNYIPGEFDEAPRFGFFASVKRGIGLSSDITLLVLLSPFFAIWFAYRVALRLIRSRR